MKGKLKTIALWLLQILLALVFVNVGRDKFTSENWPARFHHWGYPDHFHLVVGFLEAVGGLALLVPRATFYGAATLGVVMLGAAATHLLHAEFRQFTSPLVFLVLLGIVLYARRPESLGRG